MGIKIRKTLNSWLRWYLGEDGGTFNSVSQVRALLAMEARTRRTAKVVEAMETRLRHVEMGHHSFEDLPMRLAPRELNMRLESVEYRLSELEAPQPAPAPVPPVDYWEGTGGKAGILRGLRELVVCLIPGPDRSAVFRAIAVLERVPEAK